MALTQTQSVGLVHSPAHAMHLKCVRGSIFPDRSKERKHF